MTPGPSGRGWIIHPGPPLAGTFAPPGDKSVTHRAYLLGLLADGTTTVENANPGADAEATLAAVTVLGGGAVREPGRISIRGRAGALAEPEAVLDCGNSGTTLRILAGVLAAQPFLSVLAGDVSLQRRPVDRVITPLREMGAWLTARDGDRLPPLVIRGAPLRPIIHAPAVPSAQVASAVLLAGLFARGRTTVVLAGAARDHTERMLAAAGVPLTVEAHGTGGRRVTVEGPIVPRAMRHVVPGDPSAAAFFFAAAAASPGAVVTALGVSLNPTRSALLDALERMGASVERAGLRETGGEPVGDVTVRGPARLAAIEIEPAWVPRMVDEIPAWAIAAAAARGRSVVHGAAELRVKESDRLTAIATGLAQLGIDARERPDGITIEGGRPRGGTIDAAGDHRIAMAFAVLGAFASGPVTVRGAEGVATSFPGFADTFRALGGRATQADGEEPA